MERVPIEVGVMNPGIEGILLLWVLAVHPTWSQTCDPALLEDDASHTKPVFLHLGDKESYAEGENTTYICQSGYVHRGEPPDRRAAVCRNGTWQKDASSSLQCLPKSCGFPGRVAHGRMDGMVFTVHSAVTFECEEGYRLVGEAKLYCQSDGKWLPDEPPTCEKILCPAPKSPSNGKVRADDRGYGAVARYECDNGFKLSGARERHCRGTWNGTEPTCEEVQCDPPPRLEHGQALQLSGNTKVGSTVLFKCELGDRKYTVRCLHGGVWSEDPPTCPVPTTTTTTEKPRGTEAGATCEPLGAPRNGKLFGGEDVVPNASVIFSCDEGYVMRGPSNATCRPGGIWDPPLAPICEPPFPWMPVVGALAGLVFLAALVALAYLLRRRGRRRPSARGYSRQTRKPSASDVYTRNEVAHLHKPYPVTSL